MPTRCPAAMHSFPTPAAATHRPVALLAVWACALAASACTPGQFDWPNTPGARLAAYRQSYFDAVGQRIIATVDRATAIDDIRRAGAVWLGDHHRHSLLHGLQLELLRELSLGDRPVALGLEAIGEQDQQHVDDYLAGEINMRQLRRRMLRRWPGSWLDDRELDPAFFRALLSFAKDHSLPVFALEPTPRLALDQRDDRIATSVAAARDRYPSHLLIMVVGQAHLLGKGDVIGRSGIGGVAVGGLPPTSLEQPGKRLPRDCFGRSDGGVLWFPDLL